MENNLCPICIEKSATYYTECGHGYCIECLSRIKKCSMCRKFLLREQLCLEIKNKINKIHIIIDVIGREYSIIEID